MKIIYAFLFVWISTSLFAQTPQVAGTYNRIIDSKEGHHIAYTLTLEKDGTFFFHYYTKIIKGTPPEVHTYGKGKWTLTNNNVLFFTDKTTDLDAKHRLDFSHTQARYISKSPRDKTDRIVKTRLQFVASDLPWLQRIDLYL